jgi:hypothetical protein
MPDSMEGIQPSVVEEKINPTLPPRHESIVRRGSMMQPQPQVVAPQMPEINEPMIGEQVQPPRRNSMVGSRRGSMIQPQIPSTSPGIVPPPPMSSMMTPGAVPPPPPPMPEGYKPKVNGTGPSIKPQQPKPQVKESMMSQPSDLLDQIRAGKQLNKVGDLGERKNVTKQEGLASNLAKIMEARRVHIEGDDDDDKTSSDDDDWD